MHSLFKLLGAMLAIYVIWSVVRGQVYIASGTWGEALRRDERPRSFWAAIVIYTGLSAVLFTVF